MILYSIIPPEVVFQGFQENETAGRQNSAIFEAYYRGEKVLVTRNASDRVELVRLLSTCPQSFLNEYFQPGRLIDEQELKKTGEDPGI